MTPDMLVQDLASEIRAVLEGCALELPGGGRAPVKVFAHDLPVRTAADGGGPEPYVVVKAQGGRVEDEASPHVVTVVLVICACDGPEGRQGHRDVLAVVQRVYARFASDPVLAGRYVFRYPFEWAVSEEDAYPYRFGGVQMNFEIPAFGKEDPLA